MVTLSYDGIRLQAAPTCEPCTGRMWEQARGDSRMTITVDPIAPREWTHVRELRDGTEVYRHEPCGNEWSVPNLKPVSSVRCLDCAALDANDTAAL